MPRYIFSTIEDFINSDLEKLKSHLNKNQLAFVHAVEKHYNLYVNMLENGEKHAINQQELKSGVQKMNTQHLLKQYTLH